MFCIVFDFVDSGGGILELNSYVVGPFPDKKSADDAIKDEMKRLEVQPHTYRVLRINPPLA